jgi:hypothetical protein
MVKKLVTAGMWKAYPGEVDKPMAIVNVHEKEDDTGLWAGIGD